jgi:hypothetical protein
MCEELDYKKINRLEGISNLPKTLYKYRKWNDKNQKTILSERIVFMSAPTGFEDKKDCKLVKRFDLMTEEDIFNKYLELSLSKDSNWSREQHIKHAKEWTLNSPMKNPEHIKKTQEFHFQEFDKRFGVFSITANPVNLEMWNKYSDNGTGFCVGFDTLELFNHLGGGGLVNYCKKLPDIYHDDELEVEHFKQVFSKEMKWKFEEEYRTHKFYRNPAKLDDRRIEIPPTVFKEVIFGWNISKEYKAEIMQACSFQNLDVKFKTCRLEGELIKLEHA